MDVTHSGSESDNGSSGSCDERQQSRASDGDATCVQRQVREATASMTTDSDGDIDEYVNTVMTIAESSGDGTVDAVVHRPA